MTISPCLSRVCRFGVMALLMLALPTMAFAENVRLIAGVQVAKERNNVPATFVVWRDGLDALTVTLLAPTGTASHPSQVNPDYVVAGAGVTIIGPGVNVNGYTVVFAAGETSKLITITPTVDSDIEMRQTVTFEIASSANYTKSSPNSDTITIADDDMLLSLTTPDPEADEDITLTGLIGDPFIRRRGVMIAEFIDPTVDTTLFSARKANFDRDVTFNLGGTATFGSDYDLTYRICGNGSGNSPAATPAGTGTGELSHIGSATQPTSARTTAMGYQIVAHRITETFIWVTGTGTMNGSIRFNSDPSNTYTLSQAFVAGAGGPVVIQLTTGLLSNLVNGTGVSFVGGTASSDFSMTVSRVYTAGATQVEVANGLRGIFIGDVFTIEGDASAFYVATNDIPGTEGTLSFRCFLGGSSGGLNQDVATTSALNTMLTPSVSAGRFTLTIPAESTRVVTSVNPRADGVVEGEEDVVMTLGDSLDYAIFNPTVGLVHVADRDASAKIEVGSFASKPNTSGSFLVTLSKAFPDSVTIPYTVTGTAVPGDVSSSLQQAFIDYQAFTPSVNGPTGPAPYAAYASSYVGSVTIPKGQITALIPVVPGSGGSTGVPTPNVIVTLDPTRSYVLTGSPESGFLPSATMAIGASRGSVSLTTSDASAVEAVTATPATKGSFTVSIVRSSIIQPQVTVNLRISGSATYLTRYDLQIAGTPLALTAAGANVFTASVIVPAGPGTLPATSSLVVEVVPINNFIAEGSQSVIAEPLAGQNYTLGSTAPAVVTIADDEPVVSVTVGASASKPATPGHFLVSYPGVAQGNTITVNFSLAGGTAVQGTDFTASSTLSIPANSSSAQFIIDPIATPDDLDKTVIFTLGASSEYTIGLSPSTMTIGRATTSSGTKPTPGTINTGGSGGCGLGSGIATLVGLGLLAFRLTLIRRRRLN